MRCAGVDGTGPVWMCFEGDPDYFPACQACPKCYWPWRLKPDWALSVRDVMIRYAEWEQQELANREIEREA